MLGQGNHKNPQAGRTQPSYFSRMFTQWKEARAKKNREALIFKIRSHASSAIFGEMQFRVGIFRRHSRKFFNLLGRLPDCSDRIKLLRGIHDRTRDHRDFKKELANALVREIGKLPSVPERLDTFVEVVKDFFVTDYLKSRCIEGIIENAPGLDSHPDRVKALTVAARNAAGIRNPGNPTLETRAADALAREVGKSPSHAELVDTFRKAAEALFGTSNANRQYIEDIIKSAPGAAKAAAAPTAPTRPTASGAPGGAQDSAKSFTPRG